MRTRLLILPCMLLLLLLGIKGTRPELGIGATIPAFSVNNSMQIYYKYSQNGACQGPISLGDFIKHTLPYEWSDDWANTSGGMEALRAGAVAIRTFTISVYTTTEIDVGGQKYLCTRADWQEFHPELSTKPNSSQAVNDTDGIILTHSDASAWETTIGRTILTGAIDAQYRDDTGQWTSMGAYSWLKSIYDPISMGTPKTGMGQHGSRRWAWGQSDSQQEFPKWDYLRILAHYYTGIEFVGVTNPDPPEIYRNNILQIEGIPDQGNFTMGKGEERTGIRVLTQNVGQSAWPVNFTDAQGLCPANTTYATLLSYHLYHLDGSGPVCGSNCVGIRRIPMCQSDLVISSGEHHWVNGFRVFIPDDPAIISGQTYLLRFDVEHRHVSIWGGYPNFDWPSQDVPVTIDAPPGGGGGDAPVVIVDHPPAIVTFGDLVNGSYGFSWSSPNATTYDVQYHSKEIYEVSYPSSWEGPGILQNTPAQQLTASVGCNEDRRDWQFRLRGRDDTEVGDWVYMGSQTQVYPHPWLSYENIGALVLDSDPGPWSRPNNVLNLGGGLYNWTATDDQSWITTNSSGQGEAPLGIIISKPGGVDDYFGTITVNLSNFQPNVNCSGISTFQIPVGVYIRLEFETQYFPIILKNN